MSDETAFLAAIAESPGDELPRLVYADWLDERGEEERAEFVRLACQRLTATRRMAELRGALPGGWAGEVDPFPRLTTVVRVLTVEGVELYEVNEVRVRGGDRVATGAELFVLTLHVLYPPESFDPAERRVGPYARVPVTADAGGVVLHVQARVGDRVWPGSPLAVLLGDEAEPAAAPPPATE